MANYEKLLNEAEAYLDQDETILNSISGAYDAKMTDKNNNTNGIFIATNKRIIFYYKTLTGKHEIEYINYSNLGDIAVSKTLMGHNISFGVEDGCKGIKWIKTGDTHKFAEDIKSITGGNNNSLKDPLPQRQTNDTQTNNVVNQENKSKILGFRSGTLWKKIVACIVYGFIIITVMGAFLGDDEENVASNETTATSNQTMATSATSSQTNTDQSEQKEKPKPIYSLEFTPNEFKDRFNKAANEFQSDLYINSLEVQKGSVQDTFTYKFTNYLSSVGAVNKQDGSLRSVTILGGSDGTPESGMNTISSMGILIAAVNPELSADQRGTILKEIGLLKENVDILNLNGDTVRNGKKYFINSSEQIGIMFGVQDANDK